VIRRLFASGTLLLIVASNTLRAEPTVELATPLALATVFADFHEAGRFSGAALVATSDGIQLQAGFGDANREWGVPNAPDTRFGLASLTKQFTAAAILLLVQEGKLELQDPLSKHLPDLRADVASRVTIHQVLRHESGIRRDVYEETEELAVAHSPAEMLARINESPLRFEPGSRTSYSNSAYFLLSLIVDRTSGESYEDFVTRRIFRAAGMNDSGFASATAVVARMATPYELCLGEPIRREHEHPSNGRGAGGAHSTVQDLYRWDRSLKAGTVLNAEMQRLSAEGTKFGYGWQFLDSADGEGSVNRALFHNGDRGGWASHFLRSPSEDFVLVLLSNQDVLPRTALLMQVAGVLNGAVPAPVPRDLTPAFYRLVLDEGVDVALAGLPELRRRGLRGPNSLRVLMEANRLERMGRSSDARRLHELNIALHPKRWHGLVGLGTVLENQGDLSGAAQAYREALVVDPGNTAALRLLEGLASTSRLPPAKED